MTFLLSPIITCLLLVEPTPTTIVEYRNCKVVEHQIEVVQIWQPLIEQHFYKEDIIKALQIIYCESTGYSKAIGNNTNGTQDIGLWQFNDKTWAWLKGKLKFDGTRLDPLLSTKVASWLVYNDGWHHWNSSKSCWGNRY